MTIISKKVCPKCGSTDLIESVRGDFNSVWCRSCGYRSSALPMKQVGGKA